MRAMKKFFIFLNNFFDIFSPLFSSLSEYVNITIISFTSAVFFLYIFKKTSNQKKLKHQKDLIYGNIIQIVIYKDQARVIFKSILGIVQHNLNYLRYTIPSLFLITPPLILCSTQINNRFSYSPIDINQKLIIRVDLDDKLQAVKTWFFNRIHIETSPGIFIETDPLRVISPASVYWRARVTKTKQTQFIYLSMSGVDGVIKKKIVTTGSECQRFSPQKSKWHIWNSLTNYAENYLPDESPFKAVSVSYKRKSYTFLAWKIDPVILYFILTLIISLLLKPFI